MLTPRAILTRLAPLVEQIWPGAKLEVVQHWLPGQSYLEIQVSRGNAVEPWQDWSENWFQCAIRILGYDYASARRELQRIIRERAARERKAARVEKPKKKRPNPGKEFFAELAKRKKG